MADLSRTNSRRCRKMFGLHLSAQEKPKFTMRIGYQPSTHQVAKMAAAEKGWGREDLKPFGIQKVNENEFLLGPPARA
ncbi:MAG: hypothetical protein LUQ38_05425 [Methanotrichaceae archaeon]|nr:hypothetical protein [Methanotrichaceae archaeon]